MDGYYAKIEREWAATDCKGMRADAYIQDIYFKRPALTTLFDWQTRRPWCKRNTELRLTVATDGEYQSCTPDKSLILQEDVTPYVTAISQLVESTRRIYIDEVECNYSISIKDTEFPICGGKGEDRSGVVCIRLVCW
ncbi:MAG: hypothetical protein IPO07_25605 [Haliscomenobacter sp.]|nr:hypothetical protein [Haliscomenobacter sp.]MBK9491792.1 hypothetical protein [Haliscomenobacter sp.]